MFQTKFVKVAEKAAVASGNSMTVDVNGERIALFNIDGKFYAVRELCAHKGRPIHDGSLNGKVVICPWHNCDFDVTTGKLLRIPPPPEYGTATDFKSYEVKELPDGIYISAQ